MINRSRFIAVLLAVLCIAACNKAAGARYDLSESEILVWEHARNASGEDVVIVTLTPSSAERFNLFTQNHMGQVVDIYLGSTLLSSPEIHSVSASDQLSLAGFEGKALERITSGLPRTKRKAD